MHTWEEVINGHQIIKKVLVFDCNVAEVYQVLEPKFMHVVEKGIHHD